MPESLPSVSFDAIPGNLPTAPLPENVDLHKVQSFAKSVFKQGLTIEHLKSDMLWRDWLCITGRVQTFRSSQTVAEAWRRSVNICAPRDFVYQPATITTPVPGSSWVSVRFEFSTEQSDGRVGVCIGTVSLVPDLSGSWKIWMLATMLEQYKGHGHPDVPPARTPRPRVNRLGEHEVSCLVIGAGQSGLSVAGRLGALGIEYILVEHKGKVGYGWYGKYDSVTQHTIKEFNNLPFERTWNRDDPERLPASKVVEGFQRYIDRYDINIWLSSEIKTCSWEEDNETWLLTIQMGTEYGLRKVRARHLVLSIGAGHATPFIPVIPDLKKFRGQVMHSIDYKNSKSWKGKRGIVVGSGTTAHDVAQDMLDAELAEITMIQRSKTAIYPMTWLKQTQRRLYNLQIPTATADGLSSIFPEKINREISKKTFERLAELDHERFDALERAGFGVDRETGMLDNILARYGGYYIDVGTSAHIAAGSIGVKSGVPITAATEDGLIFADGSSLVADIIVLATGYNHDYRREAASIIGHEIADQLDDFWGLDSNGDLRGLMKPLHRGLWLMGGSAPQARFYSRFVALQIQADTLAKAASVRVKNAML